MGLYARNPVFNKGADQTAHPRSLISAFIICLLEGIISKLATSKVSILVSVAEEIGLNLTFSENPKTCFVATRPIWWASKLDFGAYFIT